MDIQTYLDEHEKKSLLRFLTCGSVDDGKSTLIGRLLYDSKLIFDDQLKALRKASEKNGNAGEGQMDYALLLDGLKAEREQGITIDVAYRYFTTPKRKFIIADCPGHEQYTRNMATGASTANLAIILIDARHGVLTQTKRHAYIVSLLGIKHLIVAVNKMDLFDYDQSVFLKIKEEFDDFVKGLNIEDVRYIPLSALKGENVVRKSTRIKWYKGDSLLHILETVDTSRDLNDKDFRFPVQYVCRPDLNFRGFAGTIVSGRLRRGDAITVLPSLRTSRVKRIVTADGDLEEAMAPLPVTLEMEDEIDVSSGDMIVKSDNLPHVSRRVDSIVIWMAEEPLREGKRYLVRQAGRNVQGRIESISYAIDVNTLERRPARELKLNHVGRLILETTQPIYFDRYARNHATGSFIIIDPITNNTVGAGMIMKNQEKAEGKAEERDEEAYDPNAPLELEPGLISQEERDLHLGQKGKAVLLSGTDNAAVLKWAKLLEKKLFELNLKTHFIAFSQDVDVSRQPDARITQLAGLAYTMAGAGMVAVAALPKFPASLNFVYWAPFKSDNLPLLIWLGDASTAPLQSQLVIPTSQISEEKIRRVAELLAESFAWVPDPDYQI